MKILKGMLKYYIDDIKIIIPTKGGNLKMTLALLIDENLKLITYSFRKDRANEVMMLNAYKKLGFSPVVEANIKTKLIAQDIIKALKNMSLVNVTIQYRNNVIQSHDSDMVVSKVDSVVRTFVHEYKYNSEMEVNEKRIGTDGKMYQAKFADSCQDCCFFSICQYPLIGLKKGLGPCNIDKRPANHDGIIFKIIE